MSRYFRVESNAKTSGMTYVFAVVTAASLGIFAWSCSDDQKTANTGIFGNLDAGKDAPNDATGADGSDAQDASDAAEDVVAEVSEAAADAEADVVDQDGETEAGPEHCDNDEKDGDETDVDCGGSCADKCDTGEGCTDAEDCIHINCVSSICEAPTCSDLIRNGDESDVDCGSPLCGACQAGKTCGDPVHCVTGVCDSGKCQAPTCFDTVKNGDETAVDCGGSCPTKCPIGQGCKNGADCTSNLCNTGICACPSGMANVPVLGGGGYCIDSTEVTWAAYQNFVLANPSTDGQVAECLNINLTYIPDQLWPPAPDDRRPVTYVNWCDAHAYCAWAGKRLCGQIAGGATEYADYADENKSEWFNACTAQAVNDYPYGDDYDATKCIGAEFSDPSPTEPLSNRKHLIDQFCVGGVPSLVDMSGNVAEWVNSCDSESEDALCRVRGGSYESDALALKCNADAAVLRSQSSASVGFRCCL